MRGCPFSNMWFSGHFLLRVGRCFFGHGTLLYANRHDKAARFRSVSETLGDKNAADIRYQTLCMDGVERSVKSLSFNVSIPCHAYISLIKGLYYNGGHDWTPEIYAVKSQSSLLTEHVTTQQEAIIENAHPQHNAKNTTTKTTEVASQSDCNVGYISWFLRAVHCIFLVIMYIALGLSAVLILLKKPLADWAFS